MPAFRLRCFYVARVLYLALSSALIVACGSGGSPPNETPVPVVQTPTPTPEPIDIQRPDPILDGVTLSGHITYDSIPHESGGGLDYDAITAAPVRGASVYILDESDSLMAIAQTDENGDYAVEVERNAQVKVRVRAELYQSGTPAWVIRVTDNTQSYALYVMDGSIADTGDSPSQRDLHAPSGWGGLSYTNTRVAAPFAILDAAYLALQTVLEADPSVVLPPTELRWSKDNVPVPGSREEGDIGTSFYDPSENAMYILGHANDDTDEYDLSVIIHEFSHFIEDNLSRTDSIGGSHTLGGSHDMRLAFSEGLANGFAGFASGLGTYIDSSGPQQSLGYQFSLEQNSIGNAGWFNENSIGKIIYDLADSNDDGVDIASFGYGPIYQTITSSDFINANALTTIYLFSAVFNQQQSQAAIDALNMLLTGENIHGRGAYGEGETNDSAANISFAIPVYNSLSQGETINVCSNNREGEYNGLDVRRFIRFSITETGAYRFNLNTTLGTGDKDPDANILQQGRTIELLNSSLANTEAKTVSLDPGEYILEVFDHLNVDDIVSGDGGGACFDVSFQ